ncbi:MAG: type I glutamate--ammonia ligase, partial [Ignavibacteria bacterium]|nr:type I glutamate--ammonia ligase [Ignavibacteria bacterium]
MNTVQSITRLIKEKSIEVVDIKCIDLTGRLHHISLTVYNGIIIDLIKEGGGFDGSS